MAKLAWLNAFLYLIQQIVGKYVSKGIGPMSKKNETLITPAPYAFAIWGLIYFFLTLTICVDLFFPKYSFYEQSNHVVLLRVVFGYSCIANMTWGLLFTSGYINFSTGIIWTLWVSLAILYLFILFHREKKKFCFIQYFFSELGIIIYFAWTCAATTISVAVSLQDIQGGGFLSLMSYQTLIAILLIVVLSAVVYAHEIAFGLVAIWALIGIAVKKNDFEISQVLSSSVKASAILGAAVIAGMILVSTIQYFFHKRK
jgi:hypothetical protein